MYMYTAISKVDQILFVTKIWQQFNLRRIKLIDMLAANLLNLNAMFCTFTCTKSDAIYASQSFSTCCVKSSLICDGSDHFLVSWRIQKLKICITLCFQCYTESTWHWTSLPQPIPFVAGICLYKRELWAGRSAMVLSKCCIGSLRQRAEYTLPFALMGCELCSSLFFLVHVWQMFLIRSPFI